MRSSHYILCIFIVSTFLTQIHSQTIPGGTQSTQVTGCRPQADVIFLLDGSDSISDQEFLQQKQFVRKFIELSDVGADAIRVGLAVVSSRIGDELPLSLNATKSDLLLTIDSITQPQEGSRTDLGLIEMERLFSTNSRRGVARIGVAITDGRAKYIKATESEAQLVKNAGIFLIAVGVGRLIKFSELEKIASTRSNAFNLDPLDLSATYLAETVDFQGLESCTGNLLIDTLGLMPDSKSNLVGGKPKNVMAVSETMLPTPDLISNIKLPSVNHIQTALTNTSFPIPDYPGNPSAGKDSLSGLSNLPTDSLLGLINKDNPMFGLPTNMNNMMGMTGTSDAVRSNFAALSAALANDQANPSVPLPNNNAPNLASDLLSINQPFPPEAIPEPAMKVMNTIPEPVSNQMNTMNVNPWSPDTQPGGHSMSGRINLLGLGGGPFVNMGRFNPIQAVHENQPAPTNPPTQPPVPTTPQPRITYPPSTTARPLTATPSTTIAPPNIAAYSLINQQNHQGSSPTEAASMMIKNLMSSVIGNGMTRGNIPRDGGAAPPLFDNTGMLSSAGVGIRIPGQSVADSLAFLKAEMKPARTVEEITNPIYQMFEVSQTTRRTTAKVMTTTISPEQQYQERSMMLLKEQCAAGQFVNGLAYTFKPGSCTEFLKCYKTRGEIDYNVVKCPFETFFDDQQFVCRHHEEQICWNDPCGDLKLKSYSHNGNCRAHWTCQGGKSLPTCCPLGTSYVNGYGCTRNVTCQDTCMDFGDIRTVTMNSHCKLLPISGDKNGYFEYVAGVGWVVRMCASQSIFDQAQCSCASTQKPLVEACEPELYLDFQGGIIDKSKNRLAMGKHNVDLDGGTGAFYGRSHLKLWRFSGMSLGQHVTISFRFRTSVTAKKGRLMHIVSNCCYGCSGEPKPSIDIAIIPADNGGVAVFSTTTMEAGEMFMFVPFKDTFTGWNRLEYSYDGFIMNGMVNGVSSSKKMLGNIVAKSDPLLIGSCGVDNAYDGFLDEFKFYMCNP